MTEPRRYEEGGIFPPQPEHIVNDGPPQRIMQGLPPAGQYVKPDWDKARSMIDSMERGDLAPRHEEEEAILIHLDDGSVLFKIGMDGSVEAPDPERLGEAAVIFFKEVMKVARLQGYKVPSNPEGWDA